MSIHPGPAPTTERAEIESPAAQTPPAPVTTTWRGIIKTDWEAVRRRDASALRHIGLGVLSALLVFTVVMGVYAAVTGAPASSANSSGMSGMSGSSSSTTKVGVYPTPKHDTYNAQAPIASSAASVNVTLTAEESVLSIAPNVAYRAWTFNGTVPGPVIRVRVGQTVNFTLINKGTMGHSIDFHAAQVPPNIDYRPVPAGGQISFSFTPKYPGAFMYHCGATPVMDHIANGMYGAIIVDPATGWSPAQEYVLVQSEFYTHQNADGSYSLDERKMMMQQPDYVVFNGYSAQYVSAPLTAQPNQKIRLFLVNAGPSGFSAFHVIGAIFSDYYVDGNPANHMVGNQTITIPPGGGAVVEMTIPDAGKYNFVTHSFAAAMSGAIGSIKVG